MKFLIIALLSLVVIFYCVIMLILVGSRRRFEQRVLPKLPQATVNAEDLKFLYANGLSTQEIQMSARLREQLQ